MKRFLITVSLAACLFGVSAFASEKNLPDVLQSFYKTFRNAENVNWMEVNDMTRIGFTLNGHQHFAFYSNDELIVVATEIKPEELPASLKSQLSGYKDFSISQAYQLVKNNVKEYCVIMDSPTKHLALKGRKALKVYLEEGR